MLSFLSLTPNRLLDQAKADLKQRTIVMERPMLRLSRKERMLKTLGKQTLTAELTPLLDISSPDIPTLLTSHWYF
jgi:hypothetical protein